ncbi:MAG: hypothetical protein H7281_10440, partial [Bacteriovorax sp.]|nr:hypothetical protein [Bacteriovorax sp.]
YKFKLKYNNRLTDFQEDIKKWNPLISDWSQPPENQNIYIDYPYSSFLSGATWTSPLSRENDQSEFSQNFYLNAFYSASIGSYTETTSEQSIKSGQNFPVTLGLAFSSIIDEKKHFILGSFYWAKSSKGNVTGNSASTTSSFSTPREIGGNLYYQYYLKNNSLGLFSGYDYEKLNTFNTNEIVVGKPLKNIENNIHYATFGILQGFSFYDLTMNLKASVSKTISSSTSGSKTLSGYKYILFYSYKPENRFTFNIFYKHHSLKGTTDLSIDRFGLSVGLQVF